MSQSVNEPRKILMHSSSAVTLNANTDKAISSGRRFMTEAPQPGQLSRSAHFKREMRRVIGLRPRSRLTCATLHTTQAKATGSSQAALSFRARLAPENPRNGKYGSKY